MGLTFQKIRKKPTLLLHVFWAVPVAILIRCIRPWRIVRLGKMRSDRIGHFAADAGQLWAAQQLQPKQYMNFHWLDDREISNEFWAKIVRRNFSCPPWARALDAYSHILPGGEMHHLPTTTTASRDIHGVLEKGLAPMAFLPEEDAEAKAWLSRAGWKEGESFVCLLVRDSAYLNTDPLHKHWLEDRRSEDCNGWDYHNYRDSDIATYVPAVEWLCEQGVWVLRMGNIMAKSIPTEHPRVIDYAFHPDKSDFLDIWLFANCDMCISTGSGPDMVSDVYRRPILFLNFIPLRNLFSWSNATHLPKTLLWEQSKLPLALTWREHLCHDYFFTDHYKEAGIKIVDLSPDQILAAVQESWHRIQGTWKDTEEDMIRQSRFWEILKTHPDFHKLHGYIHPEARVSTTWMRLMGDVFLR